MFNKPILTTNMCELFTGYPKRKYDRGIFKKIFLAKNKKEVEKMSLKKAVPYQFSIKKYKYYFKENTENEIYLATKEFEKNFKYKFKNQKSILQKKFDKFPWRYENNLNQKRL